MSNKEQDCGLSPTTGTVTRTVIGLNTPKSQLLRLGGKKKKRKQDPALCSTRDTNTRPTWPRPWILSYIQRRQSPRLMQLLQNACLMLWIQHYPDSKMRHIYYSERKLQMNIPQEPKYKILKISANFICRWARFLIPNVFSFSPWLNVSECYLFYWYLQKLVKVFILIWIFF